MSKKPKQPKKTTKRKHVASRKPLQSDDHSLTPDDLFDDCAICQSTKTALDEGRELSEAELKAAFNVAKAAGAVVGGSLLEKFKAEQPSGVSASSDPRKELKLSLNRDELHALLELVSLGRAVVDETLALDESASVHEGVYSQVLERAYWCGATDEVEPAGTQSYSAMPDFDEHIDETWLLPYDDATFWYELHERLTHRDLEAEFGALGPRLTPSPGELARLKVIWELYDREFEAHGLNRLHIKEQPDSRPKAPKKSE